MLKRFQPKAVPASQAPFSQVVMDDHYALLSGLVAADTPEGRAVLGHVNQVMPFLLLLPVTAVAGRVLFLDETLTATTVAGGLLAIGGVAIINLWPAVVRKRGIARC